MSQETDLIRRYFDAFNRQDLEGVMSCFGDDAVIVGADGRRSEGAAEIRKAYAASFKAIPDGKCVPRTLLGADGAGAVESVFTGIKAKTQEAVRMVGVEVLEFRGDRISTIRDYHTRE
jgi:uncharacterized protein (TIGR02246 family)